MGLRFKKLQLPDGPLAQKHVWRYLSFSRFHWLLSRKALWLSRLDLLGDSWEGSLSSAQIETVFQMRKTDYPAERPVTAVESFMAFLEFAHRSTYVNCWTQAESESHAMWKVFCKSREGVAIRTTRAKLHGSVPDDHDVLPVRYSHGDPSDTTWNPRWLSTQKRAQFEYEKEVRILHFVDRRPGDPEPEGMALPWNPEVHLDAIRIHPEADSAFEETVRVAVGTLAPSLGSSVSRSEMAHDWRSLYLPVAAKVWPELLSKPGS